MLPTMLLGGLSLALAFGRLSVAATNGIAPHEQGLAGGLFNTSLQFGGALALAIVTAVNDAGTRPGGGAEGLLDGFHPALVVPVVVATIGVAVTLMRRPRPRPEAVPA